MVRGSVFWKSLMVVRKGRLHRPATFPPLPDKMLTFAGATGRVVAATKKDAAEQFFDTAYFLDRSPDALVVIPAGGQAAVLIVDPGREADTAALRRLAAPTADWLALKTPDPAPAAANAGDDDETLQLESACRRLKAHMAEKRVYRDPKLDLKQLAGDLDMSRRTITSALNTCLGQNVNAFINSYRIEAVKQALGDPENKDKTILELAYAQGFNAKSTFNEAFRNQTGMTPSDYREEAQWSPADPPREPRLGIPAV